MKWIDSKRDEQGATQYLFHLSRRDQELLLGVLKLFPVTDAASHQLSKGSITKIRAGQPLLVEAMEEQQRSQAHKVARLVKNPASALREKNGALELTLDGEQMEWLLQALNDIRVGSWVRLGCPEMEQARRAVRDEQAAIHYTAMELSGYFQAAILQAFSKSPP